MIPALNEEEAIAATVERCLGAAERIRREAGVCDVRIVVVSDGSTDRTAEIARGIAGITVVEFPTNQGYGAAIKRGWEVGGGDLLAFIDADGTCDPEYFSPMCRAILQDGQDVVLGCRMGPDSQMPRLRRVGNMIFALLLGFLSKRRVRDTASGMRVVRREVLPRLMPLPDGLHFTPAMSARALLDERMSIREIDMPYHERVGESKLRAGKDGVRFLRVILAAVAYVRVSRLTGPAIGLLVIAALALLFRPITSYLSHGRLEEGMFYRIAFSAMLGTVAVTALCATIVCEHVSALVHRVYAEFGSRSRGMWRYETLRVLVYLGSAGWVLGAALNVGGLLELLRSGSVSLHWSRVMFGAFVTVNLAEMCATLAILKLVRGLHGRQPFLADGRSVPGPGGMAR